MNTSTSARRRRSRGAGRPGGNSPDLREALLDAAIARYATVGIGAASLRSIATGAGATPAMLHYYFGNREQLAQAVIEERLLPALAPLRERLQAAGDDPMQLIEAFVGGVGEVVAHNPWLPPLWVREVLCEGGALRETLFTQVVPQLPQMLAGKFAAAKSAGALPADIDPRLLVVSLVGLTLFPAAGAPIWRRAFDADDLDPQALARHAVAVLGHGVRAGARA